MPVLAIFEQPNLDEATYASILEQLMPLLRSANGFMSYAGGPSPGVGVEVLGCELPVKPGHDQPRNRKHHNNN